MDPRPIKVLVAVGDDRLRAGIIELLESESDIIVAAQFQSGRAAVEHCRRSQPDVVVMEMALPDMSGAVATRIIRTGRPQPAVVLLGGFEAGGRPEAVAAGAAAYLDLMQQVACTRPAAAWPAPAGPGTGRNIVSS